MPRATGHGAWLVVVWLLHGEPGCASRPEALSKSHLHGLLHSGKTGLVSFHDIVSLHPRPPVDEPLAAAQADLQRRISPTNQVAAPDLCPGGHCQWDLLLEEKLTTLSIQKNKNVMRMSVLRSKRLDEDEGDAVILDPAHYHPQLFIDTSETSPWGYMFYPANVDCEENRLFRARLESAEDLNNIVGASTVGDESGSVIQTLNTTSGSTVLRENADGTTAHYDEVIGKKHVRADIWRTSLTNGCEYSDAGCEPFFGLPEGTAVTDISTDEFHLLLNEGVMPAGDDCTRRGASSELVQVSAGEVLDREGSTQTIRFVGLTILIVVLVSVALSVAVVSTFTVIRAERAKWERIERFDWTCEGPGAGLACKTNKRDACTHTFGDKRGLTCNTDAGWGACDCGDWRAYSNGHPKFTDLSWTIYGDGCEKVSSGKCIQSKNFGTTSYGHKEWCNIWAEPGSHEFRGSHGIPIRFEGFETESGYDFLAFPETWNSVKHNSYSGNDVPKDQEISGFIRWSTDHSVAGKGWKFCRTD